MRRPGRWTAALAVVGGVYAVGTTLWVLSEPPSLAFDVLLVRSAGERLLAGELIYVDPGAASFVDPGPDDFYGPPALAVAGAVLALIPEPVVRLACFPVSWIVFLVGLAALARLVGLRRDEAAGVALGAMAAFAVFWGATLGASSVWLFGLLAGAIVALGRGSDAAAGLLVGTAAALRIYPVALLVPLVIAGRWTAVAAALAAIVGWTALGLLLAGTEATQTFIELLASLQGVEVGSSNIALEGVARFASIAGGLMVLVWAGLRARRAHDATEVLLAWGLALGGMLLVTPVAWDHYTTALLPLVVAVVAATGWPAAGLLSAAMLPASLSGGLAIVWLPILGIVVVLRRTAAVGRTAP